MTTSHGQGEARPAKAETDPASLERDWLGRLAGLRVTPERLIAGAVSAEAGMELDRAAGTGLVDRALAALAERQSTWRVAELVRELAAAVPTTLAVPADDLVPWLDGLADTSWPLAWSTCPGPSPTASSFASTAVPSPRVPLTES